MKRFLCWLLPCLLLAGCGDTFTPVMRVTVEKRDTGEQLHVELDSRGESRKTKEFVGDETEVYTVDTGKIDSCIVDGAVRNVVSEVCVTDAEGDPVEDTALKSVVYAAESIEHEIFEFQIWKDRDRWFLMVLLNTNWTTPCQLYQYRMDTGELRLLHQWDNVKLMGIQLLERQAP